MSERQEPERRRLSQLAASAARAVVAFAFGSSGKDRSPMLPETFQPGQALDFSEHIPAPGRNPNDPESRLRRLGVARLHGNTVRQLLDGIKYSFEQDDGTYTTPGAELTFTALVSATNSMEQVTVLALSETGAASDIEPGQVPFPVSAMLARADQVAHIMMTNPGFADRLPKGLDAMTYPAERQAVLGELALEFESYVSLMDPDGSAE